MKPSSFAPGRIATRLELESLQSLPCGCVSAAYRALPWSVEMVRLEAKGPHCVHIDHAAGRLLGFGETLDEEDADAQAPTQRLS